MKIILTSAIIKDFYEERKDEYKKSIDFFENIGFKNDIFFIETVIKGDSYLEDFGVNVFYSKTNDNNLRNKGVKEIIAIKKFFEDKIINDNEIIVKLTGRYKFISDSFLKEIKNGENDLYYTTSDGQAFFGCFAIRKKFIIDFINSLNLSEMERNMINIEFEFINFINKRKDINSKLINKIDVYSNINNQKVVLW